MEGGGGWEQGKERRGDAVEGEEVGGGVNIRKTILIGEEEGEQVSTPCESVIKTDGYIGKKKMHQQIPIIYMGRSA